VIAQSCVLGADDNSDAPVDAPEVAKVEAGTGCARLASTLLFEGPMRVDKWQREFSRAWIGRPPERCRNQHGHPVAIIHRSPWNAAVLATVTRRVLAEKDPILFQGELIDTINRLHGVHRDVHRNDIAASCCRDITHSGCN